MRVLFSLMAVVFFAGCTSLAQTSALEGKPAHHTADGFRNTIIPDPQKSFFGFLRMRYFGGYDWADHATMSDEVPIQQVDVDKIQNPPAALQVTWLGHSTFLIQKDGINILTDPIFSDRASPVPFTGPKRYIPHVMNYDDLPKIDYVIISHNHYDHLDEATISALSNEPLYLVPLKNKAWFLALGIDAERVIEFDWWDAQDYGNIKVEALPSQHWSARGIHDRRRALWASWSLEIGTDKVWFAGDTGYNEVQFKEIGERSGPFDLALIPIGAYEPRSFMKTYHINPEEAVLIHQDVRARHSIGMHWGAFPLTAEAPMAPVTELAAQRVAYDLQETDFSTMIVGETVKRPTPTTTPLIAQTP